MSPTLIMITSKVKKSGKIYYPLFLYLEPPRGLGVALGLTWGYQGQAGQSPADQSCFKHLVSKSTVVTLQVPYQSAVIQFLKEFDSLIII